MFFQKIKRLLYFSFTPGMIGGAATGRNTKKSAEVSEAVVPLKVLVAGIINKNFGIIHLYSFADTAKLPETFFQGFKDITLFDF